MEEYYKYSNKLDELDLQKKKIAEDYAKTSNEFITWGLKRYRRDKRQEIIANMEKTQLPNYMVNNLHDLCTSSQYLENT